MTGAGSGETTGAGSAAGSATGAGAGAGAGATARRSGARASIRSWNGEVITWGGVSNVRVMHDSTQSLLSTTTSITVASTIVGAARSTITGGRSDAGASGLRTPKRPKGPAPEEPDPTGDFKTSWATSSPRPFIRASSGRCLLLQSPSQIGKCGPTLHAVARRRCHL